MAFFNFVRLGFDVPFSVLVASGGRGEYCGDGEHRERRVGEVTGVEVRDVLSVSPIFY